MNELENRLHCCCFTGHRPQKLKQPEFLIKLKLEQAIKKAIKDGYTVFISGMAYGVDLWAGAIVLKQKKHHPELRLIAAVPFEGFESRWSAEWKASYNEILSQSDHVEVLYPSYRPSAYQKRNEWMVDRSSRVIAAFNGEPGGTKNTIDYAEKKGVPVEYAL